MAKCGMCKGRGWVFSYDTQKKKSEIQRCDHCLKYKTDPTARKAAQKQGFKTQRGKLVTTS